MFSADFANKLWHFMYTPF